MRFILLPVSIVLGCFLTDSGTHRSSPVHLESLSYPIVARHGNMQGSVEVQVNIDKDGRVVDASATSGHALLRKAALENIRRWRFGSDDSDKRSLTVTYVFRLDPPETYYEPQTLNLFDLPSRVEVVSKLAQPQP